MASKQKSRVRKSGRQDRDGLSLRTFALIGAVIVLAVAAVSAFAILNPSRNTPPPAPAEVSLDKSTGQASAPVVVVEYADFQCPYCRQFETGPEQQLRQAYVATGKVRFVFRNMAFIGPESTWAAEAAECANDQSRFWEYHDKLFAAQGAENSGAFSRDNLKSFAAELGLDMTQFNNCLDSDQYQAKVEQETTQAGQLGVRSTPTLFVNGQLISGGSDYQVLQAAIEAALK